MLFSHAMGRIRIGVWSLAALCAALCGSIAAAPFSVSLPAEPKPWERTAAKELETWLAEATKAATFSVDGNRAVAFYVGDTDLA